MATKRKQKRLRPQAGIEIVAQTAQSIAVEICPPAFPDSIIHVYSRDHGDFLFKAFTVGLLFKCKRCRGEHILRWDAYNRDLQAGEGSTTYQVLCVEATHNSPMDTWLVQADEPIPAHLKAYKIYTIDADGIEMITAITAFIHNQQKET